MKLTTLKCDNAKITDLSPLKELPLVELDCDFKPERDAVVLRALPKLTTINGKPKAELLDPRLQKEAESEAWVRSLEGLSHEDRNMLVHVKFLTLNPGNPGNYLSEKRAENGAMTELFIYDTAVTDLSPLRGYSDLKVLRFVHMKGSPNSKIVDLSPLKDLKLTLLDLQNAAVTDLRPLTGMPLTFLLLDNTPVKDLAPLKGMALESLFLNDTPVTDLSPLKGMPLISLTMRNVPVTDLSPLKGAPLNFLDCKGSAVTDLSPLADTPINNLSCDFRRYRDAKLLRSLKNLAIINGNQTQVFGQQEDECRQVLDAWAKSIADRKADDQVIAVADKLKELNAGFDGKATPTINKDGVVTELSFSADNVIDLSPVRALPGLRVLTCEGSAPGKGKLEDLWPLEGMKLASLNCANTKVTDLTPLKGLPLQELRCDFKPDRDAAVLKAIATLKTINGQPTDKVLKESK